MLVAAIITILDDDHDEGEETFTLTLSNVSGVWLQDSTATGTIRNRDLMPAALLGRLGRATAQQVVQQVEERMVAAVTPGFRGRLAGHELSRGMEREAAMLGSGVPGSGSDHRLLLQATLGQGDGAPRGPGGTVR